MPELQADAAVRRLTLLMLLPCNLSVPFLLIWRAESQGLSRDATILCGWFIVLLINLTITLSLRSRFKREGKFLPAKVIYLAIVLGALSGISCTAAVIIRADQNDYLKLALSDKPLDSIQPIKRRIVVEYIRNSAKNSAENNRNAASQKPIDPPLYYARSFANQAVIEATAASLKAAYAGDQAYAAKVDQSRQDFYDKMRRVDPDYLKAWDDRMKPQQDEEAALMAQEQKWVACTLDLYGFADAHAKEISFRDGVIVSTNPQTHTKIMTQIGICQAMQEAMTETRKKAIARQNSDRSAVGLPLAQ